MDQEDFPALLEQAKRHYALSGDEMYVANQLAENGVSGEKLDKIILELRKIKKAESRNSGKKLLLFGLSFIVVGMGLTWWSASWDFEYSYILWGLPVFGVVYSAKGLIRILGI